jgi:hypothetical protein
MLYLDTSAVLKLYLSESGALSFRRTVETHAPWLFTSRVTYVETLAGLARARREDRITNRSHQQKERQFALDWLAFHVVELTEEVLEPCSRVIAAHALRGFDAIHLCSALWARGSAFACFDERLREAARAEGLTLV